MLEAQQRIGIGRRGPLVYIKNENTGVGVGFKQYEGAIEFAQQMRLKARGLESHHRTYITNDVAVRREGDLIIIEANNNVFLVISCSQAIELANRVQGKAKEIEEEVHHADVSFDQAVLARSGLEVGLTNNPSIIDEARKEALWGAVRRYLPKSLPGGLRIGKLKVDRADH